MTGDASRVGRNIYTSDLVAPTGVNMAKRLSTRASAALTERVDVIAAASGCPRSHVVLSALEFWAQLSPETHEAIGRTEAMSAEWRDQLVRQIERAALDVQFSAVREQLVASMTIPDDVAQALEANASDDALLDAAVELARSHRSAQ